MGDLSKTYFAMTSQHLWPFITSTEPKNCPNKAILSYSFTTMIGNKPQLLLYELHPHHTTPRKLRTL